MTSLTISYLAAVRSLDMYTYNYIVLLFFYVVLLRHGQSQAVGKGPQNRVAQTSSEVLFVCHFLEAGDIDWYRNDTRISHNNRLLSPVNPGSHRIVGNYAEKEYNLKIFSVNSVRDAALYGCRFNVPSAVKVYWYKAHMIVIDDMLQCSALIYADGTTSSLESSVKEGDVISVECFLYFVGDWAPDIMCTSSVFNVSNVINMTSSSNARVNVTFSVQGGNDQGDIYCRAQFQDVNSHFPPDGLTVSGVDIYYARNIPTWSSNWTFANISVQYRAVDLTVEPVKAQYYLGDVITCSAKANPSATFYWKDFKTGIVIASGQCLLVTASIAYVSTVSCAATNSINNVTFLTISSGLKITILDPNTSVTSRYSSSNTLKRGISVNWWIYFSSFFIVAMLILIGLLAWTSKRKAGKACRTGTNKVEDLGYDRSCENHRKKLALQSRE